MGKWTKSWSKRNSRKMKKYVEKSRRLIDNTFIITPEMIDKLGIDKTVEVTVEYLKNSGVDIEEKSETNIVSPVGDAVVQEEVKEEVKTYIEKSNAWKNFEALDQELKEELMSIENNEEALIDAFGTSICIEPSFFFYL